MLQKLRNPYVMKWGLWVVIGLTIPAFVLFYGFGSGGPTGGIQTGPLVTLRTDKGKVELTDRDLSWIKDEAVNYYQRLAETAMQIPPEQARNVRTYIFNSIEPREVADFAVGQVALDQRLDQQGFRITNNQVSTYLSNANFTSEMLNAVLQARGITQVEFAREIRKELRARFADQTVGQIARTSLLELWNEYLLTNEQLTADSTRIVVPFSSDEEIAGEEIQSRYEELVARRDRTILDPEKRVYEYVRITAPPLESPTITDEELRQAYETADEDSTPELFSEGGIRVRHVLTATSPAMSEAEYERAHRRAREAQERIEGGEPFEVVANDLSEDMRNLAFEDETTSPTMRGGEIPYLLRGNIADAWGESWADFVRAADPGAVSGVIETPQGFSVVEVLERRDPGKIPFEEARPILRTQLQTELRDAAQSIREDRIAENLGTLRRAASAQSSLEGIAREIGGSVQVTSPTLVTSTFLPGIGDLSQERESLENLRVNRLSPVLQARNGDVVVIRIREVIPERIFPLADRETNIRRTLQREHEAERAREKAERIRELVSAGDSLTSAALTIDPELVVTTLPPFPRATRQGPPPPALSSVQDLEIHLAAAKEDDVLVLNGGVGDIPSEIILLHVRDIDSPTVSEFLEEIQERNFELQYVAAKRQGYLEDFRRDALTTLEAEYSPIFDREDVRDRRPVRR